ncbi:MAG: shikimate kinase [Thermoguttaceae bacterium]|nr:shikimate kinase [Thermoguttaceae bacterium]
MKDNVGKRKIVLIGYRATGKTTLAGALAARWGFDWVDLDVWIEDYARATIAEIFAREGEPYFRDLEERVVADVLDLPQPLVVATGGGAPLRESSRALMKERGVVVWLRASVETIASRILGDPTTASRRPSLTDANSPVAEIERVLAAREPIYRDAAQLIVETDGKTIDELVVEIADAAPAFFV